LDLVYRYGGVYLDCDMKLLRPLDALAQGYDFFVASEDGHELTNAAFGARSRHPAMRALIECLLGAEPNWQGDPAAMTGPGLFTRLLQGRQDLTVLPRQTFYPYNFDEPATPPHRHTFGEHTWAHSWKEQAVEHPSAVRTKVRHWKRQAHKAARTQLAGAKYVLRHVLPFAPVRDSPEGLFVETIHGHRLLVDEGTPSELICYGSQDFAAEMFMRRIVRPGDWVVEVGPETGSCALLCAEAVAAFGKLIVYETSPRCANLLSESADLNGLQGPLVQRQRVIGEYRHGLPAQKRGERNSQSTAVTTKRANHEKILRLDKDFPVDLPIRLLNVQASAAASVLAGAHRLIKNRCFDYIMLRHDGWADSRLESEIDRAISWGYRALPLAQSLSWLRVSTDGAERTVLAAD
jgi:hypothetical protein